ncbi:MAG: winged helix-turn-helix transcriptional regulator [Acutalibacteraceae bacterium]|nr:winged helix-turn-helix transcriptional regulator [Acutalibacteraceae bacterium]
MNANELEVLKHIYLNDSASQRELANLTGLSLGKINKSIKLLKDNGFIKENMDVEEKTKNLIAKNKPQSAIILSAGYGLKMVPLCRDIPKALLEVKGEILIERLIKQLHDVGIFEIYIVVGYMKEKFEYLIDKYNVELIVNNDYKSKNNLHSLKLVSNKISNSYILPSDIWCAYNPFNSVEMFSWYMVSEEKVQASQLKCNRNRDITKVNHLEQGNKEIGIAYVCENDSKKLRNNIELLENNDLYNNAFWENAFWLDGESIFKANLVDEDFCLEINTYDDLVNADVNSSSLNCEYIEIICDSLKTTKEKIRNIASLKSGMTNRSFIFSCENKRYIFRIPGEGTDRLINRKNEYDVYCQINDKNICDNIIYINPKNGYKITEFIEDSHNCNPFDDKDVVRCMAVLKEFHNKSLSVNHFFDIFEQIDYYENLRDRNSVYYDYDIVKSNVFKLKKYIEEQERYFCLTHIDSVPDNFIISKDDIRLIDWEYSGMQDPHVDIAMFAIYSMYDKQRTDFLIDTYFDNECPENTRLKIYCYIAACGLLWSNWCEYKATLGVEFGEYSLRQYRYAKEYYRYFEEEENNE